jgi:molybdate transport system substrate-binding protein
MMRKVLTAAALLCLAPFARAATIQVAAAASLSDVLREIGNQYEKQRGDIAIFNFEASSLLMRQIIAGAPADIFISADEQKMDQLQQQGLIVKSSRRDLLANTLVIVVRGDSTLRIAAPRDLTSTSIRNIAIAEPQTVPAGIYAKEFLRKIGVWSSITQKVIPTDNVRGALAAVDSGNADAGIVYKTDALISKAVRVAYEVRREDGPKIVYPAAVLTDAKDKAAAQRFLDYLSSDGARSTFRRFGFLLP